MYKYTLLYVSGSKDRCILKVKRKISCKNLIYGSNYYYKLTLAQHGTVNHLTLIFYVLSGILIFNFNKLILF